MACGSKQKIVCLFCGVLSGIPRAYFLASGSEAGPRIGSVKLGITDAVTGYFGSAVIPREVVSFAILRLVGVGLPVYGSLPD